MRHYRAILYIFLAFHAYYDQFTNARIVSTSGFDSIHRFFDTSPLSPSGQYLAVTELPALLQGTNQILYSQSNVVIIDTKDGSRRVIGATHAWDSQLGAQEQWGSTDGELFFNILDTANNINSTNNSRSSDNDLIQCIDKTSNSKIHSNGKSIHGVIYNMKTNTKKVLDCPIYHVSNDGRYSVAPNLLKLHHTQKGYGVRAMEWEPVSNRNHHAPADDGLYKTDIATGQCSMIISLRTLAISAGIDIENTPTYGFHSKFSSDGELVMFIVRTLETPLLPRKARVRVQHMFVMHSDGTNARRIISWASYPFIPKNCAGIGADGKCPAVSLRDGNHPNWVPGSHKISLNLQREDPPSREVASMVGGVLGAVSSLLQGVAARAAGRAIGRRKQWSIVTLDADTQPPDFKFAYDTHIEFQQRFSDKIVQGTHSSGALRVEVGHAVGSGHPIYHPSGDYIVTDAYTKETAFLSPPPQWRAGIGNGKGGRELEDQLRPGEVPLRLIQVSTQREVWLLRVSVLSVFACIILSIVLNVIDDCPLIRCKWSVTVLGLMYMGLGEELISALAIQWDIWLSLLRPLGAQ